MRFAIYDDCLMILKLTCLDNTQYNPPNLEVIDQMVVYSFYQKNSILY